ncbi:MAG: glycosyltransferase family 39 protein, partial [Chloroflexi bacterium]|nr:glycosyltransferase family 39 protein [Chloroflexota bacterium]
MTVSDHPVALVRRALVGHADLLALILILAVGGALRLAFFPRAPVFIGGDTSQYYVPAAALLNGEGFPLPLKRPPLYPLFMAFVGWGLGPDLRGLVAVQHVLGLGVALLAYGIGRLAFGRLVGLLSGLAAAVSGGLLIYEHYVLTEALFTFLLALAVFLSMLALRRDAVGWYVVSGLAIGLATLTRPHALVLLLLVPLVALHYRRRGRPTLRAAVVAGAAAGLLLVPWMARNLAVHGAFTLVGAAGQNLIFKTANLHHGEFLFYDTDSPPPDEDPKRAQAAK